MYKYDMVLRAARVVDPVNDIDAVMDVAVSGGRIEKIAENIDSSKAEQHFDLQGMIVVPGVIDIHTHSSPFIGGAVGHKMMARVGVVTALDMGGPTLETFKLAAAKGAGLNFASLHWVAPGRSLDGRDAKYSEIESLAGTALKDGAIGLKVLGGHYPLTPQATRRVFEVANDHGIYVAFHAGTTETASHPAALNYVYEAVDLAKGLPMHLAHVNTYCRGLGPETSASEETEATIKALLENRNIVSDTYVAQVSGSPIKIENGVLASLAPVNALRIGGYGRTEAEVERAIMEGFAQVNKPTEDDVILLWGEDGVRYWRECGTDNHACFPCHPPESRIRLLTAKDDQGEFVLDTLATDGGSIPRNVQVEAGLALVRARIWSLNDFVIKTSRNPAKLLGLKNKGNLALGMDADITVVDMERCRAVMGIANGKVIMNRGQLFGTACRAITTGAGRKALEDLGLDVILVNEDGNGLCRR